MKMVSMDNIEGTIELISGLHIGSGNTEMHIGGTDNPVIKNPVTGQPYIPGSSIKGKMRSLMEWQTGVVGVTEGKPLGFGHLEKLSDNDERARGEQILRLFGGAPEGANQDREVVRKIGPSRLAFWDCQLDPEWVDKMDKRNLLLTEVKMENSIDRIRGVAENPRNTERVPAGAQFTFRLTVRVIEGDDVLDDILRGLRLLELSGLGGSGSRGYGKLRFSRLTFGEEDLHGRLQAVAV